MDLHRTLFHTVQSLENQSTFWDNIHNHENSYNFERIDVKWWREYVMTNWYYAFYAAAIYLVTIFGLEKWMKGRKAMDLKNALIVWNAGLGVFSMVGFMRTAPCLQNFVTGFYELYQGICIRDRTEWPMIYWGLLFGISKFIELGDTVFIVLRKRPLQLLQWYHHIVTLIVVWITLPYAEPVGRWYIVMNYGVHSVMYPYFSLKMAGVDVPKYIANMITTVQFAQMIAGFLLNMVTIGLMATGTNCFRAPASIAAFLAVYGSFMILFGRLFTQSVIKAAGKNKVKHMKSS